MTPAWMQPPNDVDRWLRHGDRSGYWPREQVEQQTADAPDNHIDTGANQMPTHAQRIAEIEEELEQGAGIVTERDLSAALARIAKLERQVARLLEANPRAALPGDRDENWNIADQIARRMQP